MSKNIEFDNIAFDLPKNKSNVIKVIGVGGGGSNAINHMFQAGINGVDFVICNTDAQALENSSIPNKIQLGVSLTEGLGAGADPSVGEQAAMESMEDIKAMLEHTTKMVFITAGMGGGTGTGAAPIIASVAKELGILTVGIVTTPFLFEGAPRCKQAQAGIEKLRNNVDSLIVINNNKLRDIYGNLGYKAGFSKADEVLSTAAKGIAEVITHHYTQNIDLRDAKTVLSDSGTAIMGSASAAGSGRANEAITKALDSPLLNDNKITGAKNVLLLIVSGGQEITIDEIGEINDFIQMEAGQTANIIMGIGEDESLGDAIAVTVIATGFNTEQQDEISNTETKKIIHTLGDEQKAVQQLEANPNQVQHVQVAPTKITHDLGEIEEPRSTANPELIKTTSYIKNFNVFYEEVLPEQVEERIATPKEDDFIIIEAKNVLNDIEVVDAQEILAEKPEEEQIAFTFDMPLNEEVVEENVVSFDLTEDTKELPVNEYIEVSPVLDYDKENETRYNLEEYMELEKKLTGAQSVAETHEPKIVEDELVFEKKTIKAAAASEGSSHSAEADPMNSPISEILRERAEQRRNKFKSFNYKFNSNRGSSLDEIEKEPAYKRQGLELDNEVKDQKVSRMTLGEDSNDEIQLRSNNSFLHDNVD